MDDTYEGEQDNLEQIVDEVDRIFSEAYPHMTDGERINSLWIRHNALRRLHEIEMLPKEE